MKAQLRKKYEKELLKCETEQQWVFGFSLKYCLVHYIDTRTHTLRKNLFLELAETCATSSKDDIVIRNPPESIRYHTPRVPPTQTLKRKLTSQSSPVAKKPKVADQIEEKKIPDNDFFTIVEHRLLNKLKQPPSVKPKVSDWPCDTSAFESLLKSLSDTEHVCLIGNNQIFCSDSELRRMKILKNRLAVYDPSDSDRGFIPGTIHTGHILLEDSCKRFRTESIYNKRQGCHPEFKMYTIDKKAARE